LDAPQSASRKRKRGVDTDEEEELSEKKPKYMLEVKYYQKLFFSCLQYMTLPQISALTSRAPVPVFVKVCDPTQKQDSFFSGL
jgi:hypothetical protein